MDFALLTTAADSRARRGRLRTAHAVVETPAFMPVGTRGTVRTIGPATLDALAPPIILANTYHLMIRPGLDVLAAAGGLRRWMGWRGAVLTDSGGFQLHSLPHACAIDDDGATLRLHPGGPPVRLTPASVIDAQKTIGSDIMMVLDHCVDTRSPRPVVLAALERTHRWATRALAHRAEVAPAQALFAIVQGAALPDLRRQSADHLTALPFDGFAIGGLAVGEPAAEREDVTELVTELLPPERPRYLMGVGTPLDLLEAVHRGVDLFDCILPTALAQQGVAFTSAGRLELRRGVHRTSERALDERCGCQACARASRGYLHHLIKAGEPVGWQLLAEHNLRFYLDLMSEIRTEVETGRFAAYHARKRVALATDDPDHPPGPRPRVKPRPAERRGDFRIAGDDARAWIEHVGSGERMHPVAAPDDEAHGLYVAPSVALAGALAGQAPVVVWDVGLGAGHNAMALVRAADAQPGHAPIELHSFERTLDPLRLALAHPRRFPHLRHPAPHRLAATGAWQATALTGRLHEGEVVTCLGDAPAPDVIWWDPFSPRVDGDLWTVATFTTLAARLDRPVELFTYSRATSVRTALLLAGFHVAVGGATGAKDETTVALWRPTAALRAAHRLLDRGWLARWARSTAPFGPDVAAGERATLAERLHAHPQFADPSRP